MYSRVPQDLLIMKGFLRYFVIAPPKDGIVGKFVGVVLLVVSKRDMKSK